MPDSTLAAPAPLKEEVEMMFSFDSVGELASIAEENAELQLEIAQMQELQAQLDAEASERATASAMGVSSPNARSPGRGKGNRKGAIATTQSDTSPLPSNAYQWRF